MKENQIQSEKSIGEQYETIEHTSLWASYFSEFVNYKYGWPRMLDLMMNNGDFSKTLKISYKQLQKEWLEFMKYKLPVNNN